MPKRRVHFTNAHSSAIRHNMGLFPGDPVNIAFIAPYESLHLMTLDVIAAGHYPARSYIGDMEEGVAAAREALAAGAKVIISRGGTAKLISERLGVTPIEVGVSVHSILAYIHDYIALDARVAVMGHREFISVTEPVCGILKRTHACFEVGGEAPSSEVLEDVVAWNPDIVLGDAVSVKLARKRGLPCHLIESGAASIADAFEQAMNMLSNINRHLNSAEKIAAVLNCTHEGALLVTAAGIIEEVNRKGCLLLGMERSDLINADAHQVLRSAEIKRAVSTGKNANNIIVPHGEKPFAASVVPTMPEKGSAGMVVLFQPVSEIQKAESRIRKQLMDKGFYAKYTFRDILHKSPVMKKLTAVAKEYSATTSNIMIQGETGTGKELFAQSIHNAGPLSQGPFVAVNCAALPGSLLESELFGYAPGAFTGALRRGKTGLFELAHGGTLFLDEISEMEFFLQSRLLRAIQAREIMRIGDNKIIPVNVRIIAATNKKPEEEVAAGNLRADLFFRLNVLDLVIPPLRERSGDASHLFQHYVGVYETAMRRSVPKPSIAFLRDVDARSWPGNVRQLENLAEKYVTLGGAVDFTTPQTSFRFGAHDCNTCEKPYAGTLHDITARIVRAVFEEEGGKLTRTASRLGVDRNTVRRWLEKKSSEQNKA